MFKSHFEQKDIYEKITKPEICDSFIPTNDYRNPWFVNVEKPDKLIELELVKLFDTVENKNKIISDFIDLFKTIHNRTPLDSEVYDSLNDKVDVLTIKNYLLNNSNNTV
jgi:predicted RecB family nuclease